MLPVGVLAACALLLSGGCAVGPEYKRPEVTTPAVFKEAGNWKVAAPADTLERGAWWTLFNDPVLASLASEVATLNQNVAAATASYAQALALVREQRAALFPTVNLSADADRSGSRQSNGGGAARNSYQVSIGTTWEPDIWGRLQRSVTSAGASAQASAADLAAATLSSQGELALNYFSLRQADAQIDLLASTIAGYERTLQITQNRYTAGIAARTDVLQAETQLASARADQSALRRQRAQFEHAIAVLVGKAPSDFSLPPAAWNLTIPEIPVTLPSDLLQRRPDIAGAERRVAAANEQVGIAQAAFYPHITLGGSAGSGASQIAELFTASNLAWSLGLSATQAVFNAGANQARVESAREAHNAVVARYRQTVLNAFQDVEDQLIATQSLTEQEELRRQAMEAANLVEAQVMNRYREGQVGFTEVVIAQVNSLNARRSLLQVQADRQKTAVALIQSLGGGWHSTQ